MVLATKGEIVEELGWHTSQPKAAYELLTEPERRDIAKRGYVTKDLWAEVAKRLGNPA
jgi:hypothetical protein